MGYNTYTTTDLINNVKLVGHIPVGNNTLTSANIITLADREIKTPIMKQILSTRGGYYKTYSDQAANGSGLYAIPRDCVAGVVLNIEIVSGTSITPVNIIEESEQFSTQSPTSSSYGAYPKGNYFQILPYPTATVRMWYSKRTSQLVATSACAQVTVINSNVITVSSVPSTIIVGASIDTVTDQPPFNVLSTQTITNISGTDITLDAVVAGLQVGDWICLTDQTCIPQIPVEFRPLLEQRVVCQFYESQGYLDKLAKAQAKLKELEADTLSLITPRVKNQTKIIAPVNGGFLSGTRRITNFPASP